MIWYPLKKEYPELGLKVEITINSIVFSGKQTPPSLVHQLYISSREYDDFTIEISSCLYPAIETLSRRLVLYLGGNSRNPETFIIQRTLSDSKYRIKLISVLDYLYRTLELNQNVKIL